MRLNPVYFHRTTDGVADDNIFIPVSGSMDYTPFSINTNEVRDWPRYNASQLLELGYERSEKPLVKM